MNYVIEFSQIALKSMKKIPKDECKKIVRKVEALAIDPHPNGFKKLQGEECLFRVRSGDYRILYRVFEKKLIVLVVNVGHRKDIYRTFDL